MHRDYAKVIAARINKAWRDFKILIKREEVTQINMGTELVRILCALQKFRE